MSSRKLLQVIFRKNFGKTKLENDFLKSLNYEWILLHK